MRGLAFERLLSDLFRQQGILMSEPFRIVGEQIDGAFEYKGWVYLIEAKWQAIKQSTDALYSFQGKADRRIEGTRGLFISMSGYYDTAAERFGHGKKPNTILWSGTHIQAVLEGKLTVPDLIDASVRHAAERSQLLIPIEKLLTDRADQMFGVALDASAAQVDAEISAAVGRKFIPKLYINRQIEQEVARLVHPEREVDNIIGEFAERAITPPPGLLDSDKELNADRLAVLGALLGSYRSARHALLSGERFLDPFLDTFPEDLMGRMHVIISRAGMGKTNLLCHLAKLYAKEQPTVFLTGRSGITASTSLATLIESKLSRHLREPFRRENCLQQLAALAKTRNTSVLIIIDGINEHKDFDVINSAISHLLVDVAGLPVVIVVSCRDVYWPFFDTSLWPNKRWRVFETRLDVFSPAESAGAIAAYFDFYQIAADLSKDAREKLSHPLILRFFCEAYGNPSNPTPIQMNEIPDVRLKVLFDEYLKRKMSSICHTSPQRFRTPLAVQDFLFRIAGRMRTSRQRDVSRHDVPTITTEHDNDSPDSLYVSILGEDILLEEEPDAKTGRIQVVFTYDEFMEYIIARSMLREANSDREAAVQALVTECQSGAEKFRSFLGTLEYLALIVREEWNVPLWERIDFQRLEFGNAVCRAIGKLGAEFLGAPEIHALGQISRSAAQELRLQSVLRLRLIACGYCYQEAARKGAIDVLLRVLRHENDVVVRSEAFRCFEDTSAVSVCEAAGRLARWLKDHKETARATGIVFSEDEETILSLYDTIFRHAGWTRIFLTPNALETPQVVEHVKPALVVTDMNKPGMSGAQLATALKRNPSTRGIPILLASATILDESNRDLFCGSIQKPFGPGQIVRLAEAAIIGKYSD
jgi:CheY-like chemotaxis protein